MAVRMNRDQNFDFTQAAIDLRFHPRQFYPQRSDCMESANDTLKMLEKEKEITEDDHKRTEKDVQQLTDEFVATIDSVVENKEKEVMEV